MTLRQIRIGSLPGFQYDDADYDSAAETNQPIKAGTPVDPTDVIRLIDLGAYVTGPAGAVDSNVAEFSGATGKVLKDSGVTHVQLTAAVGATHAQGTDTALGVLGVKNPPIDADKAIYRDSAAADALVTSTWTQIKAFLKTYFDTLYGTLATSHARSHAISSTSDHSDVNLAGISNKDLMQWDDPSSKWLPKSLDEVISGQSISPSSVVIGTVEDWRYAAAIADDGHVDLPTIKANYAAKCEVIVSSVGVIDANATFMIDSTGTVTPQVDSGNCVYNIDTDVKLCIGTAAAQNPLIIKYRLGSTVANIMITMLYVKA